MLDLTRPSPSPAELLRPARALVHPLWIASLALLVVNDHVFKGGGLLPGFVTGKLSDAAGMLVAPALLAALLRARTRRAVLLSHLAVAAVFAAIKLSSPAARLLEEAVGLVGLEWHIWVDPTDLLVALPALWLSQRVLTPAMAEALPALRQVRRLGQLGAGVVGLVACMGTSQVQTPPPEPPPEPPVLATPPAPAPAVGLSSLQGGEWRCEGQGPFTSYRFDADRYLRSTDVQTPETGRVAVVGSVGSTLRLRFSERLEGKEPLGDLEADLALAPDGRSFVLDGRTYRRAAPETVIAGE